MPICGCACMRACVRVTEGRRERGGGKEGGLDYERMHIRACDDVSWISLLSDQEERRRESEAEKE